MKIRPAILTSFLGPGVGFLCAADLLKSGLHVFLFALEVEPFGEDSSSSALR